MDVHCGNCGEPWDTYHLRHDAIWEAANEKGGDQDSFVEGWQQARDKLSKYYRYWFKLSGWKFGASLMHVKHCPCCPKGESPLPEAQRKEEDAMRSALTDLLDGDDDGIASMMEDAGL